MRSKHGYCLGLVLFTGLWGACGDNADAVQSQTTPIIGTGTMVDDGEPTLFPGVVFVHVPNDDPDTLGYCTGTLLSPSHVLTAAHCVTLWNQRERMEVQFGPHPTRFSDDPRIVDRRFFSFVTECAMNPELEPILGTSECGGIGTITDPSDLLAIADSDLAVLTLSRPVPRSWAMQEFGTDPHRLLTAGETPPNVGDPVRVVGFGLTNGLDFADLGFRRFANKNLRQVTDPVSGDPVVLIDFGFPTLRGGDSGGPLLVGPSSGTAQPFRAEAVLGVASTSGRNMDTLEEFAIHTGFDATNREWVLSQLDLNSDGLWDISCPRSDLGSNPGATPTNDTDGDGVLNDVDVSPDRYNPCQLDQDLDGVGDECDTCEAAPNGGAEQTLDSDGDGLVDACDNCPFTINPLQEDEDIRPDGLNIPNDGVGDACDNCPNALNPLQTNCNEDAERTPPVSEILGDACDPSPCGDTRLEATAREEGPLLERVIRLDRIVVDGLAAEGSEIDASTGFRFCRCSVADSDELSTRDRCGVTVGDSTGLCRLRDLASYDQAAAAESKPWRLSSVSHGAPVVGSGLTEEALISYSAPFRHV